MSVVSEQLYVQRPWLLLYGIRLKVPTPRMLVSEVSSPTWMLHKSWVGCTTCILAESVHVCFHPAATH